MEGDATPESLSPQRRWQKRNPEKFRAIKQRYFQTRLDFIAWLKEIPCFDCNTRFPPECVDFDHRPGETKLFQIGNERSVSFERFRAEVVKCDLVCANCHRKRSKARRKV